MNLRVVNERKSAPRIISVASGKGGVGKTLTTVNLALAAQRMGHSVLLFDGDLGMANIDVVLGLQSKYTINDVLDGHASLQDIILTGPMGMRIIPSGSGFSRLAQLSYVERIQMLGEIESLKEKFDLMIIDTGAGISENVLHLNSVSSDIIVVTTPEPHAMTDAYAFIKVMAETYGTKNFGLVVNMVRSEDEGAGVAQRICDVSSRYINTDVTMLGSVPLDPQMQKSIMMRRAASEASTHTIAGQAWNKIARTILQGMPQGVSGRNEPKFWREYLMAEPTRARTILG